MCIQVNKMMKQNFKLVCAVFLLSLTSCDPYQVITIDFVNHASMPIKLNYTEVPYSTPYDTICHELAVDSNQIIDFLVFGFGKKALSENMPFLKFESSIKSVCFEGPVEIKRLFDKKTGFKYKDKFIITDSLFNSKK